MEFHDEKPVEKHVAASTNHHAGHRGFRVAHATDKVVHAGDNRLENGSAQNNAHVARSHRQKLVACAKELEERHHENLAESKRPYRHDDEQDEGIVEDDGRLLVLAFAQADGKKRIAANAHHHGHRHDEQRNREADGDTADAEATDALPHEIAVHDVVERFDKHADDGGHRELHNDSRNAGRTHRIELLVFYNFFHVTHMIRGF